MGVVFEEVVTQVEAPPQPEAPEPDQTVAGLSTQQESLAWEQRQATFWRRQQRLEAD